MQVDDPCLYEMTTTKEAIFAWEIKSRANVVRCILFGCVHTELKRSRHAHVPPRSREGMLFDVKNEIQIHFFDYPIAPGNAQMRTQSATHNRSAPRCAGIRVRIVHIVSSGYPLTSGR